MDRTVVKFSHCGRDIFNFSDQTTKLSSFCQQKQTGARRNTCPVCNESLAFGLLDAPVSLPYPFTNGHTAPCSFLLGANDGPQFLGEWNDTELHVGVSNSNGLVYNYTLSGMQMDQCGWEQCVCIQLVPPWRDSLIASWDKELQLFSALSEWTPERFHEEREFGSCCYGFALTFINHMRALDNKVSLSRNEFTTSQVLPRMKRASMYIKQCPECGVSFSGRRLEEAPISVPDPFSNGHKAPCAFLVAPTEDNILREFDGGSDLHTGITDTKGVVYNYTKTGVRRDHQGWERCISVPLVQPDMYNLINQWDRYLEKFSAAQMWDPLWKNFDEENHNCYSYTLMFINCVLATQSKRALSKDEFTQTFILPRVKRASKYSMLYREISQNHFYIVDSPKRDSREGQSDEEEEGKSKS